jgi:Flp pilus assembly protein TadG
MRKRQRRLGAQTIEMTLCLMPFLAIVFLIVSIAWAIFTKASLQNAVSAGLRYAITSQTMAGKGHDDSIKTVVQQSAMGLLNGTNVSKIKIQYYTIDNITGTLTKTELNTGGNIVEISVEGFASSPLAPILSWAGGATAAAANAPTTFNVRASGRMESSPNGIAPAR